MVNACEAAAKGFIDYNKKGLTKWIATFAAILTVLVPGLVRHFAIILCCRRRRRCRRLTRLVYCCRRLGTGAAHARPAAAQAQSISLKLPFNAAEVPGPGSVTFKRNHLSALDATATGNANVISCRAA